MGIGMSLLAPFGWNKMQSFVPDSIFNRFKDITSFEKFHIEFLDVCNSINSAMPGGHYQAPKFDQIKECYSKWTDEKSEAEKKELLVKFLSKEISTTQTDSLVVAVGIAAPPAAMILKRAGDQVPQIKRFKLNLIPDVFFVPAVTSVAILATKMLRMNITPSAPEQTRDMPRRGVFGML